MVFFLIYLIKTLRILIIKYRRIFGKNKLIVKYLKFMSKHEKFIKISKISVLK